jgi:hypothetical protein
MGIITRSDIKSELRPGLNAILNTYDHYKAQWPEIFATKSSKMEREIDVQMKMLGMASIKAEGTPIAMDSMGERFTTNYVHRTVGIGFTITAEAIEDNLYKKDFPKQAASLKHSMDTAKETLGAAILNNGFNPAFPIGDGQPLFSLVHPIDSGTIANKFAVGVDLNEASLELIITAIQQFRDQAGLLVKVQPKKLIVSSKLQFAADRLLHSKFRTNTANNDISAIEHMQSIPQGFRTNMFLTNPDAWFVLTDCPDGFKHFVRRPPSSDFYSDIYTQNVIAAGTERYSFGVSDFRAAFGTGIGT